MNINQLDGTPSYLQPKTLQQNVVNFIASFIALVIGPLGWAVPGC